MTFLLDTVANTVIRRLNYPRALTRELSRGEAIKARIRPLLSSHDEAEVRQSVACALVACGTHEKECSFGWVPLTITMAEWKAAFRAARATLRMNNTASGKEIVCDALELSDAAFAGARFAQSAGDAYAYFPTDAPEKRAIIRARIAREARYALNQIRAAFACDTSRKRKANKKTALRFLRFLTWNATQPCGMGRSELLASDTKEALSMARAKFMDYIASGERALTDAALHGVESVDMGDRIARAMMFDASAYPEKSEPREPIRARLRNERDWNDFGVPFEAPAFVHAVPLPERETRTQAIAIRQEETLASGKFTAYAERLIARIA